jgi:hypothetical protein
MFNAMAVKLPAVAVVVEVHLPSDPMPTTATVANSAGAAPPSTECGMPATNAAVFGSTPRMIMMPPMVVAGPSARSARGT